MRCSRPHSWGDARIEDGVWGWLCHPLSRLRAKGGDTLAQTGTASLPVAVLLTLGCGSHTVVAAAAREACPALRH